jgi:hypothetical protein
MSSINTDQSKKQATSRPPLPRIAAVFDTRSARDIIQHVRERVTRRHVQPIIIRIRIHMPLRRTSMSVLANDRGAYTPGTSKSDPGIISRRVRGKHHTAYFHPFLAFSSFLFFWIVQDAGQRDLIALYAGALGDNAVARYAAFLVSLGLSVDINERRLALTRANEHGLNVERVAIVTAERTIEKVFSVSKSQSLSIYIDYIIISLASVPTRL